MYYLSAFKTSEKEQNEVLEFLKTNPTLRILFLKEK